MSITVKIEYPYGIERIYPADATAQKLLNLTGNKTFSREHINTIKSLGFSVKVAQVEL